MAKHTTRWSPDTCSCVIEYEWDDLDPPETRTHTLFNYVNRCTAHTILPNDSDRYLSVKEENTRKNIAHQGILDNGPNGLFDIVDGNRVLKNNIAISWSWGGIAPDRVLTISYSGITLTQQQKNAIQTFLNNRFGGKVIIATIP